MSVRGEAVELVMKELLGTGRCDELRVCSPCRGSRWRLVVLVPSAFLFELVSLH